MDSNNNDPRPRRNTAGFPPQTPPTQVPNPSSPDQRLQEQPPTTPSTSSGRLRALTDLPQSLLRSTRAPGWSPSGHSGPSYSPLAHQDADPDSLPESSPTRDPRPRTGTTTGMGIHLQIPHDANSPQHQDPSTPNSPIDDVAGFQAAMAGIPGLDFGAGFSHSVHSPLDEIGRSPLAHTRQASSPSIVTSRDGHSMMDYGEGGGSMLDIPLTDTMPLAANAAPVAGRNSSDGGMAHRASKRPSVTFAPPRLSTSMLGDDLPRPDDGSLSPGGTVRRSPSTSAKSLSPTSPLTRGRTILRQMSQRIVNLSNEQDVVERTIRQKPSTRSIKAPSDIEMSTIPPMPSFGGVDGEDEESDEGLERARTPEEAPLSPLQRQASPKWSAHTPSPFKGKSLGIFPPESKFRMWLCDLLVHPYTEPTIFFLIVVQTIFLTIDCFRPVHYNQPDSLRWGRSPIDYCLFGLFVIYTVEIAARMIVSGFIMNPREYSTVNRNLGFRQALLERTQSLFTNPHARRTATHTESADGLHQPSLLRSLTTQGDIAIKGDSRLSQRSRLAHRAFLRHSFNRLDFIAVTAYWISFIMQLFAFETGKHMAIFRMLSCLRIMRLLYLTSGTTVILRSLKKAAPLLLNIGFLIGFFWLLFAIVGVQSFKSSLRRQCVWLDPTDSTNTYTNNFTFCGGHLDNVTYLPMPYVIQNPDGSFTNGSSSHKGYLCPVQSICLDAQNPYNGSISFDNILNSLELVFVIMSTNTFTDLMYYLTNSDYLSAAIFFAIGTVILYFWLISLLIAVITSSFQVIREESKASAFTGEDEDQVRAESLEELKSPRRKRNNIRAYFQKSELFWVAIITFGIIAQGFRSASMGPTRARFVDLSETFVTLFLLIEIILRFIVNWKNFFKSKRNCVDLAIALITAVIQIPPIHSSGTPYAWLTFFQIIRIYRVVLAVPVTRDLILIMLGNVTGLLNLILFVFLFVFLAAILATQMLRGSLPFQDWNGNTIRTQFNTLWNSFLGMYQVFSSENWTDIMYHVTNYDMVFNTAWVASVFFILWFTLANLIVLNMFIAVIQENFDISEDEKRLQQVKAFLETRDAPTGNHGNLALSNIFRYGMISGRRQDPSAYGNTGADLLLRDAVVRDFLDQNEDPAGFSSPGVEGFDQDERSSTLQPAPNAMVRSGTLSSMWTTFVGRLRSQEPNPFYSRVELNRTTEEVDPRSITRHAVQSHNARRRAQREYLIRHPMYNMSLFIFGPRNHIRRLCQRIVGPGRGERVEGVQPSMPVWYAFSAFIYLAIVAMVILACITTPLYQKEYFNKHGSDGVYHWFVWTDLGFAIVFTIEAVIKVIADGFFWTPNAYYRSTWGFIDGVVLVTLWINVSSALFSISEVSRAVGAFKALRALRLLNVSDSVRENFHSVIIRSGVKVLSAAFVSLSLLIPFAIYGLNLFADKMNSCNDQNSGIADLSSCFGEFNTNTPFNWDVYSPRVVSNSYFNFDDFGSSLFILFQIVSQEGWIDVMWAAQSITGVFQQPQPFASQGNAVFFVMFNLLGAVFVLTLFVSVFMRNYTEMTGVAFLTADQRSWLELRKMLRQISPSKRPVNVDRQSKLKKLLYRWAVTKTGKWQRFVTGVLLLHLCLLCAEFSPSPRWWDETRGKQLHKYCNGRF
jgi:voltage-dependent calcium channel